MLLSSNGHKKGNPRGKTESSSTNNTVLPRLEAAGAWPKSDHGMATPRPERGQMTRAERNSDQNGGNGRGPKLRVGCGVGFNAVLVHVADQLVGDLGQHLLGQAGFVLHGILAAQEVPEGHKLNDVPFGKPAP